MCGLDSYVFGLRQVASCRQHSYAYSCHIKTSPKNDSSLWNVLLHVLWFLIVLIFFNKEEDKVFDYFRMPAV
jgi:hypothetical protein